MTGAYLLGHFSQRGSQSGERRRIGENDTKTYEAIYHLRKRLCFVQCIWLDTANLPSSLLMDNGQLDANNR